MKGSLALVLTVAVLLAAGTSRLSDASTGAANGGLSLPAANTAAPPATPPQEKDADNMMQQIETLCSDPSSAACTSALNAIEPCHKTKQPALAQGQSKGASVCSAN
jgi:hypothetical protein